MSAVPHKSARRCRPSLIAYRSSCRSCASGEPCSVAVHALGHLPFSTDFVGRGAEEGYVLQMDSTPGRPGSARPVVAKGEPPPPRRTPQGHHSRESSSGSKVRTTHACDRCRIMRTKCSGGERCTKCIKDNATCLYGDRKRERNKKYAVPRTVSSWGHVNLLQGFGTKPGPHRRITE